MSGGKIVEKPIYKASRVLRELLPPPLLAKLGQAALKGADVKSQFFQGGRRQAAGAEQDFQLAKMGKVQDAWSKNKFQGGIIGNELEASFRDLFLIENRMEVPEMYKAID